MLDLHSFLTARPNELVAAIHPGLMQVMLTTKDKFDCWLEDTPDEARDLIVSYPAEAMPIVQSGNERKDLVGG